jgi:glucose-6-phosphate 1-dehydrogenase
MKPNPLREGLEIPREPEPFTFVIFGATGDLTRKKLVPALFSLFRQGNATDFRILGFSRRDWSHEEFRRQVAAMIPRENGAGGNGQLEEAFLRKVFFVGSTFEEEKGYRILKERYHEPANRIYYLATPPDAYEPIIDRIRSAGLAGGGPSGGYSRIVVEKPFGHDLQSARELNRKLYAAFREEEIYRIDHYLGKETVQNILVFRFSNGIFEPTWNNRYIDHVQITMAEQIGVGTRGAYYEKAGALRDIVQNHLLQLLCLVAMEPPNDLEADTVRDEKVKVLRSIQPLDEKNVQARTVRAQYARGVVQGREVPGYREEKGVDPLSSIETYTALRLGLDSWRWSGVPFFLRTGKRLARRATEIAIRFKVPPRLLFEEGGASFTEANTLVIRIQPDEGLSLAFNAKVPGFTLRMRPVDMTFSYGASFARELPEAYERLLLDAMLGDSTLYARSDEIEMAWRFVNGIEDAWAAHPQRSPLAFYRAGGSGPQEADRLFREAGEETAVTGGRRWRKL